MSSEAEDSGEGTDMEDYAESGWDELNDQDFERLAEMAMKDDEWFWLGSRKIVWLWVLGAADRAINQTVMMDNPAVPVAGLPKA